MYRIPLLFSLLLGACTLSGSATIDPTVECKNTCKTEKADCVTTCQQECVDAGGEDSDEACDEDCDTTCGDDFEECTLTCTSTDQR